MRLRTETANKANGPGAVLPWLLAGGTLVGLAVAGLACSRGPQKEQYGLWDLYVV